MKKWILVLALLVGISSQAFGFATVVNTIKGGDQISFSSNTMDVNVYLNENMVGKMSGTFVYKVKRDGQGKTFSFQKEGYKPVSIVLTTAFDNMFWGNFIIGGAFGSSTDSWFTANTQEYSPNQYYVQMEKI